MATSMTRYILDPNSATAAVTYSSTASTVLFWGLHLSDIAVFLSAMASFCGVLLQFYVAFSRLRKLEQDSEQKDKVIGLLTRSQTASKKKSAANTDRIDNLEQTRDDNER